MIKWNQGPYIVFSFFLFTILVTPGRVPEMSDSTMATYVKNGISTDSNMTEAIGKYLSYYGALSQDLQGDNWQCITFHINAMQTDDHSGCV
jgi:hypothetical protein